jgi:serine/threonine protein phosphatase PrpC
LKRHQWKIASASVAGFDHIDNGIPCQDAYAVAVADSGIIVSVLCDGAGSARNAELGAKLISETVARTIIHEMKSRDISDGFELKFEYVNKIINDSISKSLDNIMRLFHCNMHDLSDFHATLLGAVAWAEGGVIFHIGDGCAFAGKFDDLTRCWISTPENGEFSNETFFVTQDNWEKHLRFTTFNSDYEFISIMSDGVTPFAMNVGGLTPFDGFFNPLNSYLRAHNSEDSSRAIRVYLTDNRIKKITGDDKTFIWIEKIICGD